LRPPGAAGVDAGRALSVLSPETIPLHHPLHAEIEARLNAGSFEEAQRLLAQLGVGREHVHATTYFATRILYQRGKLDLPGVIARLSELLRQCPDFPEAEAMLDAAKRGTLQPEPKGFNQATLPPPAVAPKAEAPEPEDSDRPTHPGVAPSSIPGIIPRLETPKAPGIPRAPLVPRFTPRELPLPSYAPTLDLELSPPHVAPLGQQPPSNPQNDTVSAPPPSSTSNARIDEPPPIAIELGQHEGFSAPLLERTTAPSPGAPQAPVDEPPSVFAIATWLSERDFERALQAIERLGAESSPELSLLEVRALVGLGRKAAARRSIERLCRAPLLEPDLRSAVARLLIELGDLARAEAQARQAYAEDPAANLARLTVAWAVARGEAWLPTPRAAVELSDLLAGFEPNECSLPALGYALSALTLLASSPEAARQAVDAALMLEPDCSDALAIGALVAHRQRRSSDARRLQQLLAGVDHYAAQELAATLATLDAQVTRREQPKVADPRTRARAPSPPPRELDLTSPSSTAGASPWDDKEQRLTQGDGKAALFEFEQGLARVLEKLPARAGPAELSWAATETARYLTQTPISRHFAPYDFSLFSIERLDVALGLLYRGGVGPRTELRTRALLGLGAYSGECLRQAYAGEWVGASVDLLRMHIEGQGLCFSPFRDMNARLQSAEPLQLGDAPVHHPGAEPLGQRVALDVAPPCPWDPAPWPTPEQLARIGSWLRDSPIGLYCAGVEVPLDLSFASLRSIDRYVTLLAPALAPPDPEAPWLRRSALLVGAYLGEVLRLTRGGNWEPWRGEPRPEAYRVTLPGGVTALPVAAAFERLAGRRLEQPSDYARRIVG
jgi:tetratricopeptide (TPR) repeat protein